MSVVESLFNLHTPSGYESAQYHSQQTAAVFAANVIRRAQTSVEPSGNTGSSKNPPLQDPQQQAPKRDKLEQALSATIQHVTEKFGSKAATAMMGIMYKRLGNEAVTERNLGEALLDVTRFIDSSFGIDKGDAFLSHLNGDLNKSLNAFFANGKDEQFFASTSALGKLNSTPTGTTIAMGGPAAYESGTNPVDVAKNTMDSMLETIAQYRQTADKKIPHGIKAYTQQPFASQSAMVDVLV